MEGKLDFRSFGITTKFILWFLIVALIPLGIAIYISYESSRRVLKEEITKNLSAIADYKARQIESYLRNKKKNVSNLSHSSESIYAMEAYSHAFHEQGLGSEAYEQAEQKFRSFFTYHQKAFNYRNLFLICPDGNVVFSVESYTDTRTLYERALYKESELAKIFIEVKKSRDSAVSDFEYNQLTSKAIWYVGAPIFKGAEFLGMVVVEMDNQGLYEFVMDFTGLGQTGETILVTKVKKEILFITPLRFDKDAVLKKKLAIGSAEMLDVQSSLLSEAGSGLAFDYRQNEVLSVWRFLPTFKLGMVVKMDTREVLALADQLRSSLFKLSMGLLGVIVFVAVIVANSVSRPIKELTSTSSLISQGNLSARAKVQTNDEIGQLALSFNQMTDNLVKEKAKVEEKNAELEEQKILLEKANTELDSFVYTVSHDLKAPLRGLTAFVGFLEEDCGDKLDDEGRDNLKEISKSAHKMNDLIQDLLMLSRISRIKNPFEDVNMQELISSILERIKFDIEKNNVDLKIQQNLPMVYCDRIKISEVILNLLTNAIKFSAKNAEKRPAVEIGCQEDEDKHKFYVRDNGIGIAKEHHDQIFAIFKRLHTDKEYAGTGAGLSIVKRVIDDHQGKVWVESELGQGTTFYFTIPKNLKKKEPSTKEPLGS